MKITGRDYTDDDLIAPWDPARRRSPIPNGIRDDPDYDPRDDRDPPTEEAKPCQP
jgi:hypothetical protein